MNDELKRKIVATGKNVLTTNAMRLMSDEEGEAYLAGLGDNAPAPPAEEPAAEDPEATDTEEGEPTAKRKRTTRGPNRKRAVSSDKNR